MLDGVKAEQQAPGSGIKFTSGNDLTHVVLPQYRLGFLRLMAQATKLSFRGDYGVHKRWTAAEMRALCAGLAYANKHGAAQHLVHIDLRRNEMTDEVFGVLGDFLKTKPLPAFEKLWVTTGLDFHNDGGTDRARGPNFVSNVSEKAVAKFVKDLKPTGYMKHLEYQGVLEKYP